MNIPFTVSTAYVATAVIKKLFDSTDNTQLAAIHTAVAGANLAASLATVGIILPTRSFRLGELIVSLQNSVSGTTGKVEFGLVNAAGDAFIPLLSVVGLPGGSVRVNHDMSPAYIHDGSAWFAAVRLSASAASTITASGSIEVQPK